MRYLLAALACLACLLPAASAQGVSAPPAKLRVAVADFEVRNGSADIGKNLADAFAAPLFQTRRFELFDRRQTVALLNEIRFTQSGLAEQAQQLQARNIDVLVTGTINVNNPDSLRVDVMFTNVRTAQVQFADSLQGRGPQDFPDIASRIVAALAQEFPLQGVILGQDSRAPNRYYVSVGSGSNVVIGLTGKFFQFQAIGGGRQIPLEAGTFKVVELSLDPTVSVIEVVNLTGGYRPKEGDAVTISLTGDLGPASSVSVGSLMVRSNAPMTTVLLDGQVRGTIAAADGTIELTGLPPGQHRVTARAPGFAETNQTVTVASGAAAHLDVMLSGAAPAAPATATAASGNASSKMVKGSDMACSENTCAGVQLGPDAIDFSLTSATTVPLTWSRSPVVDLRNAREVRVNFEVLFVENYGVALQVVLADKPGALCAPGASLNLLAEGLTSVYGAAVRRGDCSKAVAVSDQDLGVVGWRKASVRVSGGEVCLYGPGDTRNVCYKPAAGELPSLAYLGIGAAWTMADPPNGGRARLQVRNVEVLIVR